MSRIARARGSEKGRRVLRLRRSSDGSPSATIAQSEGVLTSRKLTLFTTKLLVGLGFFTLVGRYAGFGQTLDVLGTARVGALLVAGVLGLASVIAAAAGVVVLGRALQPGLPWRYGAGGFFLAWSTGFFLGRLSELTLPVFWRRHVSLANGAAVVLVDKAVSLVWMLALGAVGLGVIFGSWVAAATSGAGLAAVIGIATSGVPPAALHLVERFVPTSLRLRFGALHDALRALIGPGQHAVAANFAISGFRSVLHGLLLVSLMGAIDRSIGLATGMCVQAMVSLSSLIPGSLMGLGYWEMIYVVALSRVGVPAVDALAASLLWRATSLILTGIVLVLGYKHTRESD